MEGDARFEQRFDTLRVARSGEIAWVTIEHPPLNLLDAAMLDDLDRLSIACTHADAPRVVIFESADPDFFIAHADVEGMIGRGDAHAERRERLSRFAQMTERFRTLPIVTIAIVEGRARGGGSELVLAFDLCFAASETARLAQPEVTLGLLPGGGATQRLPRLVGRSRALEIMLGGQDYTAAQAEAYGWITRALPRDELRTYVSDLADRIASFPAAAVEAIKGAVEHANQELHDGLREEHRQFRRMLATDDASVAIGRFLAAGGQTRAYELDLGAPPRVAPLAERLVGTWSLHSYDVSLADGTRRRPLGVSPLGQLIYGSDGHMSAQLTRGTGDVDDQQATDAVSYAGTYLVDEPSSSVVHHVHVSLAPSWIGHDLRRDVRWDGELLVLSAELPEPGGAHGTHELSWRPIGSSRTPY